MDVLARTMGDVFPEIRAKQKHVEEMLKREEEAFNKTLDRGIELFQEAVDSRDFIQAIAVSIDAVWRGESEASAMSALDHLRQIELEGDASGCWTEAEERFSELAYRLGRKFRDFSDAGEFVFATDKAKQYLSEPDPLFRPSFPEAHTVSQTIRQIPGHVAFKLYDTYGFPLDLTELMARERGLTVDNAGFEVEMDKQRARARAAQKKQVIELSEVETKWPTKFVGYETLTLSANVVEVVSLKEKTAVVLDATAAYAEMGGQVGDTGELAGGGQLWNIVNTQKTGSTFLHFIESVMADDAPAVGSEVTLIVDKDRRNAIQRHHTVTHLLHWALHEVVSKEATQKGSFVGPDKLTFDFNSAALTPAQVRDIERLVNERIVENSRVSWIEVPYADVRGRADVMQFFGDKYGETVRVVQVGGHIDGNGRPALDGYSMELCAGTHTRATGEIGLFRINAEAAIAAGVRRIEAVAGLTAYDLATADMQRLHALATNLCTPLPELEKRIEGMLAQHKELEKALKSAQQREAAGRAKDYIANAQTINGIPAIITNLAGLEPDAAVALAESLKGSFAGVVVLGTASAGAVALVASVSKDFQGKVQAGKIIQAIAPIVGGKGGGKPDFARGGGKDASKLDEALGKAAAML